MILAIDQGTTGTTCIVFDEEGRPAGRAYREFEPALPAARLGGARRQRDLGGHARGGARGARGRRRGRRSRASGSPTSARPWWPGTRAPASRCTARSSGRTGAPPRAATSCAPPAASRSSASAPGWCSTPTSPARRSSGCAARAGWPDGAVFGTIDSWLAYKLTGRHVTDYSNASRTLLFDIRRLDWDPELCELLGVDPAALPEPRPSAGVFGETSELGGSVPVAGHRRGPAGGALRAGLPLARARQEHLRHRQLRAPERRTGRAPARGRPAHDRRLGRGGPRGLRARGGDLRDRRRGAVAARRPRRDRRAPPRPRASPARSRATTACTSCPRSPGLGSPHWDPYARGTIVGPHARHRHRAPRPRGARVDRLPDGGRRAGDGVGRRACGSTS